ncbi:MAG: hypothetical protein Q4G67_07670 [Actinomycetia bacterium]|nr:hypothetical protein [Actinomycetes bacterium]
MIAAVLGVVGVSLTVAGLTHAARPAAVRDALVRHGLIPAAWHRLISIALIVVEVALGAGILASLLLARPHPALAFAAGALLVVMTGYVHLAAQRTAGRHVPCGCGLGEAPLGLWATVRAALLALFAVGGGVALLARDATAGLAGHRPEEIVIIVAATIALTIGIALLPQAREDLAAVAR